MKRKLASCVVAICGAASLCATVTAQDAVQSVSRDEARASLAESAAAFDESGERVFTARLISDELTGTFIAPVRNARFTIENQSGAFINYATGRVSFYDAQGARCGDGLFAINAFAAGETVETDAPDLRVTCTPQTWRIALTRVVARGNAPTLAPPRVAPPNATTSNIPSTNNAALNKRTRSSQVNDAAAVLMFVSRDGKFYVSGVETAQSDLGSRLKAVLNARREGARVVRVTADADASFANLVAAVEAARELARVDVVTDDKVVLKSGVANQE